MPIRSQCPHCSAAFKVDESYIGQMVVCTKCKNQYQVTQAQTPPQAQPQTPTVAVTPTPAPTPAPGPISVGALGASAPAAAPMGSAPAAGAAIPKSRRRARKGGMFRAPEGGSAFRSMLWLGLLLFVGTFAIKQMSVDFSLVRTNSASEVARLQLAKEAARNSVSHQASELELELREMREAGAFDPNEEYLKKQEQLQKVREANKGELEKVNKKYNKLQSKAVRNLTSASATNLSLLQMSWWMKLLLDLAKIAGCFLVLYSAMQIVCDPNEDSQVKTFATVCSGIVLTTILALSLVTVFG